jgi:hypothetical protein
MQLMIRKSRMQQTVKDNTIGNSDERLSTLSDIQSLRTRARKDIGGGAVTLRLCI